MTTSQILQAARQLIEAGWCQGAEKRRSEREGGTDYCALGAVVEVVGRSATTRSFPALQALQECLPPGCRSLPGFNDSRFTTKARVLALFDRALVEVTK